MLKFFKEILSVDCNNESTNITFKKKIQIATCSLLIEIANSDDEFSELELQTIIELMKNQFKLETEEVEELIELSHQNIENSVSLYEFTDIINKNFNNDEKFEIIKNLWLLILIDENLDSHEEYFLRKIHNNLNLPHKDLITAKIMVKEELGL